MKVRPRFWKTLGILGVIILVGGAIIFGTTFNLFLKPITEWGWQSYLVIGLYVTFSVGLIIATFLFSYYEVYKKYVAVKKGTKTLIYYYSDVVYIDEAQYEKSKTIAFYTRKGHVRYLIGDKKDILYQTMLANCKDLITKEEFQIKYPKVKI